MLISLLNHNNFILFKSWWIYMYLLWIMLHVSLKTHSQIEFCMFIRRGQGMPSLSSSRSGTTCLSWLTDWWGSTRRTTVPSRWLSTQTTWSYLYRKSMPTAEAQSDNWSADIQEHLFKYKHVWESYLFFSCKGAPVQKPCVECPSGRGIQTCGRRYLKWGWLYVVVYIESFRLHLKQILY